MRGGQSWISGLLGVYEQGTSCLCGDVTDDGGVDIADVVYLVSYLYNQEGHDPPPDPIERADANNDCEVDIADVIYLVNYLFVHGPPPECGWICPSDLKTPTSGKFTNKFPKSF